MTAVVLGQVDPSIHRRAHNTSARGYWVWNLSHWMGWSPSEKLKS